MEEKNRSRKRTKLEIRKPKPR